MSTLVEFYAGRAADSAGRRIEDIWGWDLDRLEGVHDYIQWLFPLTTRSPVNPSAPVLTGADVAAFQDSPALRERLQRSLRVMLRFYGLEPDADAVTLGDSFEERRAIWLTPGNHNHLRLTRIMTCTATLGLGAEAAALQRCLLGLARDHPRAVSPTTVSFWESAV